MAFDRRTLLGSLAAAAALRPALARDAPPLTRPIPSTGEALPLVGIGSWMTFNVGEDEVARNACAQVMGAFFEEGGRLIDSSPMYGSSQERDRLRPAQARPAGSLFSADKVWISSGQRGPEQIETRRGAGASPRFDLLQVHNLLAWEEHLRDALRDEGGGQAPLCRDHHLPGAAA